MVTAALLMVGCGSGHPPTTPEDTTLHQSVRAAGVAISLERPEEAAIEYERALERARARDDAAAIGDYGYDLAVTQLVANHPKQALATVRMTRTELALRGTASFPALDLTEAYALYRIGQKEASDQMATRVEADTDPVAAARASFLRGLIADEKGDTVELDAALARLARPISADQQADVDELLARRDLRQGAVDAATSEAERAANLRRTDLDYRDMARALALAADAEVRVGNREVAAEFYMRAGQSAAAQRDTDMARLWLQLAMELGNDPMLREAARHAIAELIRASSPPDNQ
jgi:hypothetical protein